MSTFELPPLPLADWQDTRNTIAGYAKILGTIRRNLTPPQKHWWHVSLRVAAPGLTTTPISAGERTFELLQDFTRHELVATTSDGARRAIPLAGQSQMALANELFAALDELGITVALNETWSDAAGAYDPAAVTRYWRAMVQIDAALKAFRYGFRRESSPVQLWPHHFDLAVVWFSGRLVPGQDSDDPEYADEQMNFGFSTGDEGIPAPYFYATAYPTPAGLTASKLPDGARWETESWTGAVLPYVALVGAADGRGTLLNFLQSVHAAGAALMA